MSVTILSLCKACHGRHEFFVPGTSLDFDPMYDLAYTCPRTSKLAILNLEGEWTPPESAAHVNEVIVRKVPK